MSPDWSRRDVLGAMVAGTACALAPRGIGANPAKAVAAPGLLLRDVLLVDGTGGPGRRTDVRVRGDRIDHIGRMDDVRRGPQIGVTVQRGSDPRLVSEKGEAQPFVTATGERHARHHHAHAFIPAHRVYCDSRLAGQVNAPFSGEMLERQAPTATTSRPL